MKLSEAMRSGAFVRGHGHGRFFIQDQEGYISSCALGAVYESCTGECQFDPECVVAYLRKWFPELGALVDGVSLERRIIILNDESGWSREQIADWLETLGF